MYTLKVSNFLFLISDMYSEIIQCCYATDDYCKYMVIVLNSEIPFRPIYSMVILLKLKQLDFTITERNY